MARTSKNRFVIAITRFYHTLFVQKARAIIQDAALVALIIVCFKGIGVLIKWAALSPWLEDSFGVVKGVIFLVLYIVLSGQLLDEIGVWTLIGRVQNALKGKLNGLDSVLAA